MNDRHLLLRTTHWSMRVLHTMLLGAVGAALGFIAAALLPSQIAATVPGDTTCLTLGSIIGGLLGLALALFTWRCWQVHAALLTAAIPAAILTALRVHAAGQLVPAPGTWDGMESFIAILVFSCFFLLSLVAIAAALFGIAAGVTARRLARMTPGLLCPHP